MAVQAPAGAGGRRLLTKLTEAAAPRTMVDEIIDNLGKMSEVELEDALGMLVDGLAASEDLKVLRDAVRGLAAVWKEMHARRTKLKEASAQQFPQVSIRERGVILGPLDQPASPPPPSALRTQLRERLEASIMRRLPAHGLAPAPRKPCPHQKGEVVLSMLESSMWPRYLPGRPLEVRWQTDNRVIGGQTRYCTMRQAHIITLDVSPRRPIREVMMCALHEVAHAALNHLAGTDWWADPRDRMTLDEAHAARAQDLARAAARLREAGRAPAKPTRDLEAAAEAFAEREIGRWLKE